MVNTTETVDKIPLNWDKSTFSSFKGYKVYRQEGLGVDNINGDLIYSTIAIGDTSFTDYKFINGTQYSYRVYIISDDGKLGGSNTLTLNSVNEINYISNGRFEISTNGITPDFWFIHHDGTPSNNIFSIDGSEFVDGKFSLKINFIDSLYIPNSKGYTYSSIYQRIFSNDFVSGNTYKLSFWIKSNIGQIRLRLSRISSADTAQVAYYIGPSENGWIYKEINFVMPVNTLYLQLVINSQFEYSVNGETKVWMDNIKLAPAN